MQRVRFRALWNKEFFREFLLISIPILLGNVMTSSLHIIDNIMVGSLGDLSLASVAQANQLSFIMRLTLFGLQSGCAIFAAQHWGNNNISGIRRTLGISLISATVFTTLISILATVFPTQVMRVYILDEEVIALGASYLRMVGPSYLVVGISAMYNTTNRATERVRVNLVAAASGIVTNIILNWCLIFGNLGFPRMEVRGAALATAIAACVEACVLVGWTYYKKYPAAGKFKEMIPTSGAFVKSYYRVAVPVMLNESIWSLGMSAYAAVYGRISTQAVAAMNVFNTVDQVIMAAIFGIMNAASVMIGKRIGAGKEAEAYNCARRMMYMCVAVSVVMGAALFFGRQGLVSIFNISQEAKVAAMEVMVVAAAAMAIRSFNSVNVVGVLRAGGDAVFSMVLDGGSIWLIGVPLAILGGLVLRQPLWVVYLMIQAEEVFKGIVGYKRFRSCKWINNLVR
ncbi:MATE family efflux transporter [Christensenellaceae bacterium OttesenSCG-928-L17]|nr:MATE family efflux transporter [Christensenellaceae bacterium OttesenSCG-928-L17]